MLPLNGLEENAIRDTPQECCDGKVTTCRQELDKNREFCGAGRVPRQDELDKLIYNDEAPERCCEEKKIEEPPPKKKCCDRKAPLVHVRYFQSPLTTVLQPVQAVSYTHLTLPTTPYV